MNRSGRLFGVGAACLLLGAGGCSASGSGNKVAGNGGAGGSPGGGGASSGAGGSLGGTGGGVAGSGGTGNIVIVPDGGAATGGTGGAPDAGVGGSAGSSPCSPVPDTPKPEQCGNGLDDDLNGFIDESCPCTLGATQPCFGGQPSQATAPNCTMGTQTCTGTAEFPGWGQCEGWACGPMPPPEEICDNGLDDDCDGQIDEGCELDVTVNIDGDCVTASCPPQAPYAIGCMIIMSGNDPRGCIANDGGPVVYFQEGDKCGAGHVDGTLSCSSHPGSAPLGPANCAINKFTPFYPPTSAGCPATS